MNNLDTIDHGFDLENCRIPIRLAFIDGSGFPRIVSLWFNYMEGDFLCVTHKRSWIVGQIERSPKIGFEISSNSPPYRGIRGTGSVDIYPLNDDPLLEKMIARYLGEKDSEFGRFLLNRRHNELILRIKPVKQSSWNYKDRMQDAVEPSLYS